MGKKKSVVLPPTPPHRCEIRDNPVKLCHEISRLSGARVRSANIEGYDPYFHHGHGHHGNIVTVPGNKSDRWYGPRSSTTSTGIRNESIARNSDKTTVRRGIGSSSRTGRTAAISRGVTSSSRSSATTRSGSTPTYRRPANSSSSSVTPQNSGSRDYTRGSSDSYTRGSYNSSSGYTRSSSSGSGYSRGGFSGGSSGGGQSRGSSGSYRR